MSIKRRLQGLERTALTTWAPTRPSPVTEVDRLVREDLARQEARRAKIGAALAGDDPQRRAWAQREFERDAAFAALPEDEQLRLKLSAMLEEYRATHGGAPARGRSVYAGTEE